MAAFLGGRPPWPLEDLTVAVNGGPSKIGDSEGVFRSLRKVVISAEPAEIEANASNAAVIWMFLLEFCARRKVYRLQVLEVVNALFECKDWEQAFSSNKELEAKARELPDDVQAALALQHEAIAKSFTPAQMEEFKKAAAPQDLPAEVHKSLARAREANKLHAGMLAEAHDDAPEVPVVFGEATQQDSSENSRVEAVCEELRDAVEAILDIDDSIKFEQDAIPAFAHLRRAALHAVSMPEALEQEASHAPAVLNFLIDFTKKHRIRIKQSCEVLNLLMDSPPWASAFEASPMLLQRAREELSEEAQVAFGLQNPKLMGHMSQAAQRRAASDESADQKGVIGQAKKVAQQMDTLKKSMRLPAVPAARPAAAVPEKTPAPADEAAPSAPPVAEWREAKTQEGKVYYYNVRTREVAWKLPPGAALKEKAPAVAGGTDEGRQASADGYGGGKERAAASDESPSRAAASQAPGKAAGKGGGHGYGGEQPQAAPAATTAAYSVRDRVQVWSNSAQAWCSGVVEKVQSGMVLVAFQLPSAKPDEWARKELPADNKALRKAGQGGGSGGGATAKPTADGGSGGNSVRWSSHETDAYGKYWKESGVERDPNLAPQYLGRAGLPRRTLREIWAIGASAFGSKQLGTQEFNMMCRLVGHCQALQRDERKAKLLNEGGRELRKYLMTYCYSQPPPQLPQFRGA